MRAWPAFPALNNQTEKLPGQGLYDDGKHGIRSGEGHDHAPTFFRRWLCSTNHKDIGTMYLLFAIFAGCIGTFLSLMMRLELEQPGLQYFANEGIYNVFVSAHGMIMIFFMIMPAMIGGFGNWFVPLMIGAPDMAFPRMNNISFWLLPACAHAATDLAVPAGNGGCGRRRRWLDFGRAAVQQDRPSRPSSRFCNFVAVHLAGAASILGAINFITTIFNMRAPGMTLHKMPLFVWSSW